MSEGQVKFEFDQAFQSKLVSLFMRDSRFAQRALDLVEPGFLAEEAHGHIIRIIGDHVRVYKSVPDIKIVPQLIKSEIDAKRIRQDMIPEVKRSIKEALSADLSNSNFVLDKVSDFAKHQAMETAILQSVGLLEKGDFQAIERAMKDAMLVGENDGNSDYDYFSEIESRTQIREDFNAGKTVKDGITTGLSSVDAYMYHNGWGRKELSVIMGAAKAGKSLSLGEFTKNASLAGYNTLYASLEVSTAIIADRLDANLSDTAMRLLKDNPKEVERKIVAMQKNAGALKMREYPSGTLRPNQLNRVIEDYRSEGIILDLVTVDYADIMAANYRSDNHIDNMRSIFIDIRAIAFEHNVALLTATQATRSGAKSARLEATDVAEDFNKIRTADLVLGINATDAEKQSNEARLTWVASRNSEDNFSLRIRQDRQKLKFLTSVIGKE